MIGQLLDGRYQVIQLLGSGGFGRTYIATDIRRPGNPKCVVKHLTPASSDPNSLQTARRLFASEAETLEQLGSHDQIPRLLAYFEQNQEFFLVQEFIPGHTLSVELYPGQRWTEVQVISLLQEVLEILEFIHQRGVIHRDVKPDNLIRRQTDNKLVLVDFGAVKQVSSQQTGQNSMTVAIGTPGYMPSEQGRGQPRPSSDIYALGIIAIQALTGYPPLQLPEDSQTGEILWQHLVTVPSGLAAMLTKMVRYHFKDRYPSAHAALQELRELIKSGNLPASVNPPPPVTFSPLPASPLSEQNTIAAAPRRAAARNVNLSAQNTDNDVSEKPFPWFFAVGALVILTAGGGGYLAMNQPKQVNNQNVAVKSPVVESPQNTCAVNIGSLNIRSEPNGTIVKAIAEGTGVAPTGKEQDGWMQINSPAQGWVFKEYINCPTAQTTPVSPSPSPTSTPTSKPKPSPSTSEDKGRSLISQADREYRLGNFNRAIALLQSIPSSSKVYQDAQKSAQEWQRNWTASETKFNQLQKAFEEKRWDDIIAAQGDPVFANNPHWQTEVMKLAKIAKIRRQPPSPSPSPSPTKEVPSCDPKVPGSCPSPSPDPKSTPSESPSPQPSASNSPPACDPAQKPC